MAESVCAGCGRRFFRRTGSHRYCTPACRERHKAQDPARRRRYSSGHQKLRAAAAVAVEAGRARCARCGEAIAPGSDFDLVHAADGNSYWGISHSSCNRAAPRIRENGLIWSRRWSENAREGTIVAGREIRRGGAWVPL
jgi:hypothetical protein